MVTGRSGYCAATGSDAPKTTDARRIRSMMGRPPPGCILPPGRLFLGARLGRLVVRAEIQRGVDERDVRERLGKVAEETARCGVVLLGEEADIVCKSEEALEKLARLFPAALQAERVGEPEAAGKEHALARRQAVDAALGAIAQH